MDDPLIHLAVLNRQGAPSVHQNMLTIGSDIEIAGRVKKDVCRACGEVIQVEGQFWRYCGTHWEVIPAHELRLVVHEYDGAYFNTPGGGASRVKLSKSRIDSVLNELAALVAEPAFFATSQVGINCASGFIRFAEDGVPSLLAHAPDHRCRHTLPGRWSVEAACAPPQGSLLARLLDGIFHDDDDANAEWPFSPKSSAQPHSGTRPSSSSLERSFSEVKPPKTAKVRSSTLREDCCRRLPSAP